MTVGQGSCGYLVRSFPFLYLQCLGDDEKHVSEIIMLLLDVTVEKFYERTNSAKLGKLLFVNI